LSRPTTGVFASLLALKPDQGWEPANKNHEKHSPSKIGTRNQQITKTPIGFCPRYPLTSNFFAKSFSSVASTLAKETPSFFKAAAAFS